ncbi:glycoside hydrolase family 76 protein [Dothidotthia symphoricarpi CBS 119687]|uniref:Glycoside hydrolase family 76 protein n=1 Tax=Dothidotthia symphoricarpi CBS 119687 TaxID=1392245 RepID=A0A6A6AIX9_9PLEO|nr:glycoside hydrolase family 76 protein [Dothidotthia symphoricarpi CBS 119687]KAF2131183.1 glycoside hydrolase family 76 protein [Dothidotthia symphoricarpi CBS 119687]
MVHFRSLLLPLLYLSPALADFADNANTAIKTLQDTWYNVDTGLWDDLWWQSGNMVETIARFGQRDSSFKQAAIDIISNTYAKSSNQHGHKAWKNEFYDDMGWWAMGWIASYDLTGDHKFLNTAKDLFEDMTGGWNTPCNGGIWWNKQHDSIAAISNELFLSVAAHLANRANGAEKAHYQNWAQMEWDWFSESGVINADRLINDGIDKSSCKNDGRNTFTYNQGVILAGLSELARAKGDGDLIQHAYNIANAVISRLTKDNNILNEPVGNVLDIQSALFKGVFVRGLSVLNENKPQQAYTDFLKNNANAAWSRARKSNGVIAEKWQGGSNNANAASHAAGIDVLVAASRLG